MDIDDAATGPAPIRDLPNASRRSSVGDVAAKTVVQVAMSSPCAAQPCEAVQVKMSVAGRMFQREVRFEPADAVTFADVIGGLMRALVEAGETTIQTNQGSK